MDENSEAATPIEAPVGEAEVLNEGDLAYEMSEEQERAYVAKVLGQQPPSLEEVEKEVVEAPAKVVEAETEQKPEIKEEKVVEEVENKSTVIEPIKTDDLYVDVTVHEENDEGELVEKTIKLTYDPKNPTAFLPDDFKADSNSQLLKILDARDEMRAKYNEREKDYNDEVSKQTTSKAVTDQLARWDQEIIDLQEAGVLDKSEKEDDAAAKKIDAVYDYMMNQNKARTAEGKPIITSFGTAFNLYEHDAKIVEEKEAKIKSNEDAKKKGAMVGGGSAAAGGGAKAPLYVAGSAHNIYQLKID